MAVKGLVMCGLSCSVGVDRFVQTSVKVSFISSFVVHHWSSGRHQRIFQPWLFGGSLRLSANMFFFNPRGWWNPLVFMNLAVPGLVACDCLISLELIHFHMCVSFLFTSDPVSVTRGIFWPWLFIGSPLPLNIVFFNPRGWWNPKGFHNFGSPRPSPCRYPHSVGAKQFAQMRAV